MGETKLGTKAHMKQAGIYRMFTEEGSIIFNAQKQCLKHPWKTVKHLLTALHCMNLARQTHNISQDLPSITRLKQSQLSSENVHRTVPIHY